MIWNLYKLVAALCAAAMLSTAAMAQVTTAGPTPTTLPGTLTVSSGTVIVDSGPVAPVTIPGAVAVQGTVAIPAMVKGPYLGVNVAPVSADLTSQLRLTPGVGLVVVSVDEGSPAADAGIKVHDVLDKLDDQILIDPMQLLVLIRLRKPGDDIKLSVIHEGTRGDKNAKLVERDVMTVQGVIQTTSHADVPKPGQDMIQCTIKDGIERTIWVKSGRALTLSTEDGKPLDFKAVDTASGEVIFEGSVRTKEDRKKIPADVSHEFGMMMMTTRNFVPSQEGWLIGSNW